MARAALGLLVVIAGIALAGAPKKPKAPAKKPAAAKKGGDGGSTLAFGTIEFDVKGALTIFLDGRELGQPPLKPVKVLAGKHQLRIANAEAKIVQTQDLDVQAGQVSTFSISLE